ncbi:MAG: hypothetical protein V4591_00985 [Bdellovibrionota bacterium]
MVKLLSYMFITFLVYIIFYLNFEKSLLLFSFSLSYLLICYLEYFVFLPIKTIKELTKERIDFNIVTSQVKKIDYIKKLKFKILFLSLVFISTAVFEFQPYFIPTVSAVVKFFKGAQAFITIENQEYSTTHKFQTYKLSSKNQSIKFDSSSFLKIHVQQGFNENTWKFILKDSTHQEEYFISTKTEDFRNFSANTLYENFPSHKINLSIVNGKKKFYAILIVLPVPLPVVTLKQMPVQFKLQQNSMSKLAFTVNVESQINLLDVVLAIRTKSGFHYEKNLATFVGKEEKQFNVDYTEIQTSGIPFAEDDILYVKAVAKTHLLNQNGESQELQFNVNKLSKEDEQQGDAQGNWNRKNFQSDMDALAAQGILDESWRKNILDNITRLKKEDKPENSKMIEYLESQLR